MILQNLLQRIYQILRVYPTCSLVLIIFQLYWVTCLYGSLLNSLLGKTPRWSKWLAHCERYIQLIPIYVDFSYVGQSAEKGFNMTKYKLLNFLSV